jgi:hypothetical protein
MRASVGMADDAPIVASELSARGLAQADFHGLLLDMANATLNRINDEIQQRRAQEQLHSLEPEVDRLQRERPDCGVLLVPVLRQIEPDGFSAIRPGPGLVRIEIGVGRDRSEAGLNRISQLKSAPGPAEREFEGQHVWIPAIHPVDPPPPAPPFPIVGLATFASRAPTLTNVAWSFLPIGFDDVGETTLEIPQGAEPRFYVLALPAEMTAWDRNPRGAAKHTAEIAQATRGGMPVALLDVYVPFDDDAAAAAIFPADAATAKLFRSTPEMLNWAGLVPHTTAYSLLRWASPEQIRRLDESGRSACGDRAMSAPPDGADHRAIDRRMAQRDSCMRIRLPAGSRKAQSRTP